MQPLPDAGLLPVAQPPPAGHARAAAQLPRQLLPGDAGLEHEHDALERPPIRDARTAGPACTAGLGGRDQRLDEGPHSSLISRSGGEDAGDDMAERLRRQAFVGKPRLPTSATSSKGNA